MYHDLRLTLSPTILLQTLVYTFSYFTLIPQSSEISQLVGYFISFGMRARFTATTT